MFIQRKSLDPRMREEDEGIFLSFGDKISPPLTEWALLKLVIKRQGCRYLRFIGNKNLVCLQSLQPFLS
ncbi:hypothetical protein C2869_03790 [Saccharobesus litoralis]|uniref:Uncharacterized protein n=1 Tax=Saccharobesus litoralis TaxID=2172099 RepID=A0A2S0VN12_9ALTE|nr:hypothetical protein C2869_03790 [Saccharobesus litoralis]